MLGKARKAPIPELENTTFKVEKEEEDMAAPETVVLSQPPFKK